MPAPTALQRVPDALTNDIETLDTNNADTHDDDTIVPNDISMAVQPIQAPSSLDQDNDMATDAPSKPLFDPEATTITQHRTQTRKVRIPPHRMAPLKSSWPKIYPPLVEHLKLQVRMNIASKAVELRTSKTTLDTGALQKGADFIEAFTLGFDVDDAIALLRLDDLYIQTFEVKDVKTLNGEHLSRAIGRIAGKDGKTKFAIENASRTRIVLADSKIHILGGFKNIHIAREAVVSLILGSPPGKVYGNLRTVASRMKERF